MVCFYGWILLLPFVVANKYKLVHVLLWLLLWPFFKLGQGPDARIVLPLTIQRPAWG